MIGNVNVPGALAADIANKVDKVSGKGLSTNDFTNEYKSILDNMGNAGNADDITALKDMVFPKVSIPTDSNTTYTLTKGTRTITGTANSTTTEVSIPELGTWNCQFVNSGNNESTTVTLLAPMTLVPVGIPPKIYGVEWDGSSSTQWTRIGASANFSDPVPYVAGASSYSSPFDNIAPWKNMVTSTDANAGTVVAITKFYYRLTQLSDNGIRIEISEDQIDGFSVCPACMDRGDGAGERDVVYVGRYHCATSTYKSTTGVKPQVNTTRANFRTNIHNLGTKVYQADFAIRFTLWLLYLVEFADWNSQAKIGKGCRDSTVNTSSAVYNMGYTDSMPYHTGTTVASRDSYGGTQYRNIEGLWDNCYDWMDGCYYNSNGMNVILNPSSFSDSTGGTLIGLPTNGYPSEFTIQSSVFPSFYPTTSSGSTSTYSCDSWYFYTSSPCLCVGGDYSRDEDRGLFCVGCSGTSLASGYLGSRLMLVP